MVTPVAMEPMLGYFHPCSIGLLTMPLAGVGQCQAGSLTGAVASERVSEAPKVPQNGWKPFAECKGRRELDCDTDGWSRYESRA